MTLPTPPDSKFIAVCSEVGRGHPQYLDSCLKELGSIPRYQVAWWLPQAAYRLGAQGGIASALYSRLRGTGRPSRLQLALLDEGLRRRFRGYQGVVLVDHPLLAHLLAPVCRVAYVHGEVAAPPVCAVPSAWRTFAPMETTRQKLLAVGCQPSAVLVTGLLVEPALVAAAESAFAARLARLSPPATRLTVGLFTSGAYPKPHMDALAAAAGSVLAAGHQAVVFPGIDKKRVERLGMRLAEFGLVSLCSASKVISPADGPCFLVMSETRPAETSCTALNFGLLDVMVAAAHERTNWAVGLGLPMFALLPHIGPFAQENYDFASGQDACLPLEDPARFGRMLTDLHHSGRLAEMSRAGWGRLPITGAKVTAESLLAALQPLPLNHDL
ncbi:hypothetical protein FJY71_05530 [candidate division WOR-3 bacterium]|nr:hypothetical protein [candidate division WOR-3 bacterium]